MKNLDAIDGKDLLNLLINNHNTITHRYKSSFDTIITNIPGTEKFIVIEKEMIEKALNDMIIKIKPKNLRK